MADNFLIRVNKVLTDNPSNFADTEGTDTYKANILPAILSYTVGQCFNIKFTNTNTGSSTLNLNTLGVKAILKNGGDALGNGDIKAGQTYLLFYNGTSFQIVGQLNTWRPNSIPMGSVFTSGVGLFINDNGIGVYLAFDGTADDRLFFNDSLNKSGDNYDGSNLNLRISWRISTNGAVGDVVGWQLSYKFITAGDNSVSAGTVLAQQDIDVSAESANIDMDTVLGALVGVSGAESVMITLTRKSTSVSDTYAGQAEIVSMQWVKV